MAACIDRMTPLLQCYTVYSLAAIRTATERIATAQ